MPALTASSPGLLHRYALRCLVAVGLLTLAAGLWLQPADGLAQDGPGLQPVILAPVRQGEIHDRIEALRTLGANERHRQVGEARLPWRGWAAIRPA
jgi:hypothetical protein